MWTHCLVPNKPKFSYIFALTYFSCQARVEYVRATRIYIHIYYEIHKYIYSIYSFMKKCRRWFLNDLYHYEQCLMKYFSVFSCLEKGTILKRKCFHFYLKKKW